MYTKYQILNTILSTEFSKSRKLAKLDTLLIEDKELYDNILQTILDGETESEVTEASRIEADDREHWISSIGLLAAADLLTLGKVQPETMVKMAQLPNEDFAKCVKFATKTARTLNQDTVDAEKQLNLDTVQEHIV